MLEPLKKQSGRNSYRPNHRSPPAAAATGSKYRVIDFKRDKLDMPATVLTLEYDPNRSAHIALVQYEDGEKRYILAPNGLKVGDTVVSGRQRRHQARQRPAPGEHPRRYLHPQRGAVPRQGRPARPRRRQHGPADGQGGRHTP